MARNSWDTAELEITHVSSWTGGALPFTASTLDVIYVMEFNVGAFQAPFSGVVDPEHYLLRQRGEVTVSAPLSNEGPVELYYSRWQDSNTLVAEISPGQTLTIPFDRSDPGNHTIEGHGSWVFYMVAWATTAPAQLTLESAHTTLTLSDEPPPPPEPDGPATWVPLADAGVDFDFYSQTPNVRLEGSTVVCDGTGDPVEFMLLFDPPQRVRLTVLSYTSTADASGEYEYPAYYYFYNWDPFVDLLFENTAHPAPDYNGAPYEVREGFIPPQNESLVPVEEVFFGPAYSPSEPLQDRYEVLIEIDVPGGGGAACFWTDLVGVSQVCSAPGPAPEPEPELADAYLEPAGWRVSDLVWSGAVLYDGPPSAHLYPDPAHVSPAALGVTFAPADDSCVGENPNMSFDGSRFTTLSPQVTCSNSSYIAFWVGSGFSPAVLEGFRPGPAGYPSNRLPKLQGSTGFTDHIHITGVAQGADTTGVTTRFGVGGSEQSVTFAPWFSMTTSPTNVDSVSGLDLMYTDPTRLDVGFVINTGGSASARPSSFTADLTVNIVLAPYYHADAVLTNVEVFATAQDPEEGYNYVLPAPGTGVPFPTDLMIAGDSVYGEYVFHSAVDYNDLPMEGFATADLCRVVGGTTQPPTARVKVYFSDPEHGGGGGGSG